LASHRISGRKNAAPPSFDLVADRSRSLKAPEPANALAATLR